MPSTTESPFASLERQLKTWFYKPDLQAIRIVMGTMAAHYLKLGDAAWLFVVAPPGSGKTTTSIMGSAGLVEVQMLSDFTENTFLSGFHGHQTPGLLEKLGSVKRNGQTFVTTGNAIILAKDFTSVLSMRREKRAAILGQLREIHDGMFRKDFGTGVTKIWRGKITVVAAVTPAIDRHYAIFSTLGERFLQLRLSRPDSEEAGEWALRQQGKEGGIQKALSGAVTELFDHALKTAPKLPAEMQQRLAALAEVVALSRTHVTRNNFGNRDIEYVPEPEANTRISKQLGAIVRGIATLNQHSVVTESEFQDDVRVALDCIPPGRRQLVQAAIIGEDVRAVPMAATVRERQIEELEALGVLREDSSGIVHLTDRVERLLTKAGLLTSEAQKKPPQSTAEINQESAINVA